MNTPTYLFVYGTLLSSLENEWAKLVTNNAKTIKKGKIQGMLFNLGSYPAVLPSENPQHVVHGEIVELKNLSFLQILDDYEGYFPEQKSKSDYLREKTFAYDQKNLSYPAWVYFYRTEIQADQRILSGNYLEFLSAKK